MKKWIFVLVIVLMVAGGGYLAYTKFIAKEPVTVETSDETVEEPPQTQKGDKLKTDVPKEEKPTKAEDKLYWEPLREFEITAGRLTERKSIELPILGRAFAELFVTPHTDDSILPWEGVVPEDEAKRLLDVSLALFRFNPLAIGNRGKSLNYLKIALTVSDPAGNQVAQATLVPTRGITAGHMGTVVVPKDKLQFSFSIVPEDLPGSRPVAASTTAEITPTELTFVVDTASEVLATGKTPLDPRRLDAQYVITFPPGQDGAPQSVDIYINLLTEETKIRMTGFIFGRDNAQILGIQGHGTMEGGWASLWIEGADYWGKIQFALKEGVRSFEGLFQYGGYPSTVPATAPVRCNIQRVTTESRPNAKKPGGLAAARYQQLGDPEGSNSFAYLVPMGHEEYSLRWYRFEQTRLKTLWVGAGSVDQGLLSLQLEEPDGKKALAETFMGSDSAQLVFKVKFEDSDAWEDFRFVRSDQVAVVESEIRNTGRSGYYVAAHVEGAEILPKFDIQFSGPYVFLSGSIRVGDETIENLSGFAIYEPAHTIVEWISEKGLGVTELLTPPDEENVLIARTQAPLLPAAWIRQQLNKVEPPKDLSAPYKALETGTWSYTVQPLNGQSTVFDVTVSKTEAGITINQSGRGKAYLSFGTDLLRAIWDQEGTRAAVVLEIRLFDPKSDKPIRGRLRTETANNSNWVEVELQPKSSSTSP